MRILSSFTALLSVPLRNQGKRFIHETRHYISKSKEIPAHRDFPFAYHEVLSLNVTELTNLGSGLGRFSLTDGSQWVVMVPFALPGEIVKCQVYKNHQSYSEADLISVEKPSPDRVEPFCKYFGECGGCQYQHLSIELQRLWKKQQVEEVMKRIGGIPNPVVNEVVGTKETFGYRSKV